MKKKMSPIEFAKLWNGSACLQDVSDATGLSKRTLRSKASAYRRKGVPLKKFVRLPETDWAEVARAAKAAAK